MIDIGTVREALIARVIQQIKTDFENDDDPAVYELLSNISDRELETYLPKGWQHDDE